MNAPNSHPHVKKVQVEADRAGQRVDNFLIGQLNGVPRSLVYKMIRKGQVRVNSKRIKAEYKLVSGDEVRIPPVHVPSTSDAPKLPSKVKACIEDNILFEDERLMVINKPAGMAVHGGSGLQWGLIEVLREIRPKTQRIELVHRLDRDTSGCILIAKRHSTLRQLHAMMRENTIQKSYQTIVKGRFPRHLTAMEPLLKRHSASGEWFVQVHEEGQTAKTIFKLLSYNQGYSLVEAKLVTGRTHQIRVHLKHHGFPVIGDDKYTRGEEKKDAKGKGWKRMFLHAEQLIFQHPHTQARLDIKAPFDDAFSSFIQAQQL